MSELTRYNIYGYDYGMEACIDGDLVKADEAEAALAAKDERIAELEQARSAAQKLVAIQHAGLLAADRLVNTIRSARLGGWDILETITEAEDAYRQATTPEREPEYKSTRQSRQKVIREAASQVANGSVWLRKSATPEREPATGEGCPDCGSTDRFIVAGDCASDQYEMNDWHKNRQATTPEREPPAVDPDLVERAATCTNCDATGLVKCPECRRAALAVTPNPETQEET